MPSAFLLTLAIGFSSGFLPAAFLDLDWSDWRFWAIPSSTCFWYTIGMYTGLLRGRQGE